MQRIERNLGMSIVTMALILGACEGSSDDKWAVGTITQSLTSSLWDAASGNSRLLTDTSVGATQQVIASRTFMLSAAAPVLFHGCGNWFHQSGTAIAQVRIRVDGNDLSETSMLFNSVAGQRHPFMLQAVSTLGAGSHTVELVALRSAGTGTFTVQASSQVTNLVGFANVQQLMNYSPVTISNTSFTDVLSGNYSTTGAVFLQSSATIQRLSGEGDAITEIFADGSWKGQVGINDMVIGQDDIAPQSGHAIVSLASGIHTFNLKSAKLDYPSNTVAFNVGAGATLVTAWGNIAGHKETESKDQTFGNVQPADLASTTFDLPPGHNGRVWIAAQGRWLDLNNAGTGGLEAAVLVLDGREVGPFALQNFVSGKTMSQRNFALGYLAIDLAAGTHTVAVRVRPATPGGVNMPNFTANAITVALW